VSERYVSPDGRIDLRMGRWQDVLADVEACDAVITDPPYSARTHSGHNGAAGVVDESGWAERHGLDDKRARRRSLSYEAQTEAGAHDLVEAFTARCKGWIAVISDHESQAWYAHAAESAGRYVFAPLPFVELGSRPRLCGDGPSSWTCWITAARPRARRFQGWGTLPGAYVRRGGGEQVKLVVGGKPLWLMSALVRDYSRPGDLIVDPFAGGGTTLLAAAMEGRRAIGAEMDPETYAKAVKRLKRGYTTDLFEGATP
jgi:site-specific DNA-methyltransferase (adenine-specific)